MSHVNHHESLPCHLLLLSIKMENVIKKVQSLFAVKMDEAKVVYFNRSPLQLSWLETLICLFTLSCLHLQHVMQCDEGVEGGMFVILLGLWQSCCCFNLV